MRARHRWSWIGIALLASVPMSVIVFAQEPWTVTVTPTLNPLPVGFCAAIQLTVLDASGKDIPRNPLGARVTIADFDIVVTGSSVAANRVDASHWQACACQGASPGSMATVIASYPARALAATARVPGVTLERTATFVVAPAKGAINPPACVTANATPAAVQAPLTTVGLTQIGPAAPRSPAPASPAAIATPSSAPPATGGTPPGVKGGAIGAAIPGAISGRVPPFKPGPVTVAASVSGNGSWFVPGPVTVPAAISAEGSWFVPGPVTVGAEISATGSWLELEKGGFVPELQPAPPGR